ncbi:ClpXP protease specificity-enhancing factor SspB [Moraxella sp.]|uniref:ClpXP protease specificity-enhancing factor SspB n=1 Tax=Moraxella sp. TaxID=479 RepID=UPI0026DC44B7|nr:ClpXP protease specificity-enhancing factor SspB [Moraxella sp.]MDO4895600.1 ClpXP protease specificity-enhancing factor SspB [Moraxella sp.]
MTTPKRPYFVRAMHEWLEDNHLTAYLMVDATHPDLVAPIQYAQDGRLVLAASYQATHALHIDNDSISFAARFGGVSQDVWIPMSALMGIYAKEEPEHGLFFDPNEYADVTPASQEEKPTNKGGLRLVD